MTSKKGRKEMERFLWFQYNNVCRNPSATDVREYKKHIAKKSDKQLKESYDRQVIVCGPLTTAQRKEIDSGVESMIKTNKKRGM